MQTSFPTSVDEPLVQDANFRFGPPDRQYIDEQIRGIQYWLLSGAAGGVVIGGDNSAQYAVTVGPVGSGADFEADGVQDDVTIQAAIAVAAANVSKRTVLLLGGTYSISQPITIPSNVTLEGSGPGVTILNTATGFDSANFWTVGTLGTETTGTAIPLAADATQGQLSITATAGAELSAVAAGDFLFLISDGLWEATDLGLRERGEYVQVVSVVGAVITLRSIVRDSYTVADSARLYRMTFTEKVTIRNLSIRQEAALNTRTGNPPPLVSFQRSRDCTIDNCELYLSDGPAFTIFSTIGSCMRNCFVHDLTDNTSQNRYGYGVLIGGASENCIVTGNRFKTMRHAVDAGPSRAPSAQTSNNGIPRGITVVGNVATRCTNSAFGTHNEAEGWNFTGNVAENCDSWGFFIRGRSCNVAANTVQWCSGGINVGSQTYDVSSGSGSGSRIIGNSIRHIKQFTPSSPGATAGGFGIQLALTDNVHVRGNVVGNVDNHGIRCRPGVRNCTISGNTVENCNMLNAANVSGIEIESSGAFGNTSIALSVSSGVVTVTGLTSLAANQQVGRKFVLVNASNAANNGAFVITAVLSSSSLQYTNVSAVNESATLTWYVENSCDNIVDGNTVVNTPQSMYDHASIGHAKYAFRDSASNGNVRNTYSNNRGIGMETSLYLVNCISQTSFFNNHDSLTSYSGNEKLVSQKLYIRPTTTPNASPTTIHTISTTSNRNIWVTGYIQATNGGGGYWLYRINCMYQNNAGTLTARLPAGASDPITQDIESSGSAVVTANVSGTTVPIIVTGIAGSVTWSGELTITEIRS